MAKSKRRPTLREQVDRLKRQNMHLKAHARAWKREWEDANRDFTTLVKLTRERVSLEREHASLERENALLEREHALLKRIRTSLEPTTRDPPMRLQ